MTKTLPLFIFLFLVSLVAYCQSSKKFSYGIKEGYISYAKQYINTKTVIEGASISGSETHIYSIHEGFHIGGFTRLEFKQWSLQPELVYSTTVGSFGITGPTPFSQRSGGGGGSYKTFDFTLNGGFKPVKFLRLYTGLGVWYQFRNNKYLTSNIFYPEDPNDPLYEYIKEENQITKIRIGIENSHIPFVLAQKFGAGLEIKNFSFDITYERSLTLTRKEIIYDRKSYPFRVSSTRFFFSLSYRFYKFPSLKKKPQSDVPLFKEK
jgi:hypothetical protein